MRLTLRAALAILTLTLAGAAGGQTAPVDDRLYRAWGGEEGIRATMEDFFVRLRADPRTAPFFKDSNREHLVRQLTDQLCELAGGPCKYEGAPMGPAHRDLDIGKAEFNALVEVLQQSMDARGIPFRAQNAMLARLAPMHREIVTRR